MHFTLREVLNISGLLIVYTHNFSPGQDTVRQTFTWLGAFPVRALSHFHQITLGKQSGQGVDLPASGLVDTIKCREIGPALLPLSIYVFNSIPEPVKKVWLMRSAYHRRINGLHYLLSFFP